MKPLINVAVLAILLGLISLPADDALAQCEGETLQQQEQSAPQQQFELTSAGNMESLVECAEWAFAIAAVYAIARLLFRRPRVPLVLFPVQLRSAAGAQS